MLLEELTEQVNSLKAIVEKQSQLIGQTGQQLLDLQVKNVRSKMNEESSLSGVPKGIDFDDFVTNEDIVQLVGELQGQLDFLEDRSIKRTFNTLLTATKVDGKIAPLSNRDGEEPSPEIFPSTVKEFLSLNSSSILLLCEFYELVSTVEEQTELELSLTNKQPEIKSLEQRIASFTLEQFDELKDELARYLGLTFRTQSGIW